MQAPRIASPGKHPFMNAYLAGGALPRTRAWLRARPRLQSFILAPAGLRHRLPETTGGIFVLLYHGVDDPSGLRRQIQAMLDRGRFVTWDETLDSTTSHDPLGGPRFCLTFDDGHKEWVGEVLSLLQELNVPASFFITTGQVVAGKSKDKLTWSDCTRLADHGMHLGSHSLTHARLAALDLRTARQEVRDSKAELEARLGMPILDFSLPYGLPGVDYTPRDLELVAEAGYRSAASALPGRVLPGDSAFELHRCGLHPSWAMAAVATRVHE